jgi:peptidyl-prolyl cis-trans isomerase SurA
MKNFSKLLFLGLGALLIGYAAVHFSIGASLRSSKQQQGTVDRDAERLTLGEGSNSTEEISANFLWSSIALDAGNADFDLDNSDLEGDDCGGQIFANEGDSADKIPTGECNGDGKISMRGGGDGDELLIAGDNGANSAMNWSECNRIECDPSEAIGVNGQVKAVLSELADCESTGEPVERNFSEPTYTNEIAAIVNDQIITMERVRLDVAPLLPQIRALSQSEEDFRNRLLAAELETINGIINRKLIVDAFVERGGKFSEAYEKREYENYLKNISVGNRLEFSKCLKEYGKSVREFKKDVAERTIVNFMARELRASQMEVSPAKIKEYYDGHMDEFFRDSEIDLKRIIVESSCESESKLMKIRRELSDGHDFYEVAKKYSDNMPAYDIGFVARGDLLDAISQALEDVEIGEYSDGIVLGDATYIFLVAARNPAKQLTLEEASQDIEKKLFQQFQEEARINWIQKLRDSAYIKIYIEAQQ